MGIKWSAHSSKWRHLNYVTPLKQSKLQHWFWDIVTHIMLHIQAVSLELEVCLSWALMPCRHRSEGAPCTGLFHPWALAQPSMFEELRAPCGRLPMCSLFLCTEFVDVWRFLTCSYVHWVSFSEMFRYLGQMFICCIATCWQHAPACLLFC